MKMRQPSDRKKEVPKRNKEASAGEANQIKQPGQGQDSSLAF
jgi:hypothetical protein